MKWAACVRGRTSDSCWGWVTHFFPFVGHVFIFPPARPRPSLSLLEHQPFDFCLFIFYLLVQGAAAAYLLIYWRDTHKSRDARRVIAAYLHNEPTCFCFFLLLFRFSFKIIILISGYAHTTLLFSFWRLFFYMFIDVIIQRRTELGSQMFDCVSHIWFHQEHFCFIILAVHAE